VISAIPNNKRDYRPHERSRSAWELAWHIAADVWFWEGIVRAKFEANPDLSHRNPTSTPAELAAWYLHHVRPVLGEINGIPPYKLLESHSLGAVAVESGMKFPAFLYLQFGHNHMVPHRGQLSTYLRAMGSRVPSIYGPSADTSV
jgi:hypothetical protein